MKNDKIIYLSESDGKPTKRNPLSVVGEALTVREFIEKLETLAEEYGDDTPMVVTEYQFPNREWVYYAITDDTIMVGDKDEWDGIGEDY